MAGVLYLDFETRGRLSLPAVGLDNYSRDADTSVLCAGFAFDQGPVSVWSPATAPIPDSVGLHVAGGGVVVAHNAAFELAVWNNILVPRLGAPPLSAEACRCTMAVARFHALPASLDKVARALGLSETKSADGHRIMLKLCKPRSHAPLTWWEDADSVAKLFEYCRQDVEVLRKLHQRLGDLSREEQALWVLDRRINDMGVAIDMPSARAAEKVMQHAQLRANTEMASLTGGVVDAVTQTAKLLSWARSQGARLAGVAKSDVDGALADASLPEIVRRALELRRDAGRTSLAKVSSLLSLSSTYDGRLRDTLQYCGANTGRWAGRGVQVQNLPRGFGYSAGDISTGLSAVRAAAETQKRTADFYETFGDPTPFLVSALRGLFVPAPGKVFVVGDFANVEGRVLAWVCGEQWKLKAFRDYDEHAGPDVYCQTYAHAYGVPTDGVTPEQRQVGKTMELLLGYGGSVGALRRGGGDVVKTKTDEELSGWVRAWRSSHSSTVAFWSRVEQAAFASLRSPGLEFHANTTSFLCGQGFLRCQLPSGRAIFYPEPKVVRVDTPLGMRDAITYKSTPNAVTRVVPDSTNTSTWSRVGTFGGKLVENITQAVARDLLAAAMHRVSEFGFNIVMHVHDEIVCEADSEGASVEMAALMQAPPGWAEGLPVAVKTWSGNRYGKG